MRETLQNLALVLFGVLFVWPAFEAFPRIASRRFVPPRVRDLGDAMERNRQAEHFFTADPELGFKVAPHTDFIVKDPDYTIRIKTNLNLKDVGFRGSVFGGPVWGCGRRVFHFRHGSRTRRNVVRAPRQVLSA